MKKIIGYTIIVGSIILGLYVGGWIMFIKPIIDICMAFDSGTLMAIMVGISVIKCIFASAVGGLITYLGMVIGTVIKEM